jgi:hypothetical protein
MSTRAFESVSVARGNKDLIIGRRWSDEKVIVALAVILLCLDLELALLQWGGSPTW